MLVRVVPHALWPPLSGFSRAFSHQQPPVRVGDMV